LNEKIIFFVDALIFYYCTTVVVIYAYVTYCYVRRSRLGRPGVCWCMQVCAGVCW